MKTLTDKDQYKTTVLFLLKQNQPSYRDRDCAYPPTRSSGLLNSAMFLVSILRDRGVSVELEIAVDGNEVDKYVYQHRPKYVIIEALWVTPEKLQEVTKLHPTVTFIVRLHSEAPFLAQEGVAFDWISKYTKIPSVNVACNSFRLRDSLNMLTSHRSMLLPNYYPIKDLFSIGRTIRRYGDLEEINVGCFGAIRPLKNQVQQAIAAIALGESSGKRINFHMNTTRVEAGGDPILKSLRAIFSSTRHSLIEHGWLTHEGFLELMGSMDVSMQASFTETFNIVSADSVNAGVPVVTSDEIYWSSPMFQANPNSISQIRDKLLSALKSPRINVWANKLGLLRSNVWALEAWNKELNLKI